LSDGARTDLAPPTSLPNNFDSHCILFTAQRYQMPPALSLALWVSLGPALIMRPSRRCSVTWFALVGPSPHVPWPSVLGGVELSGFVVHVVRLWKDDEACRWTLGGDAGTPCRERFQAMQRRSAQDISHILRAEYLRRSAHPVGWELLLAIQHGWHIAGPGHKQQPRRLEGYKLRRTSSSPRRKTSTEPAFLAVRLLR